MINYVNIDIIIKKKDYLKIKYVYNESNILKEV